MLNLGSASFFDLFLPCTSTPTGCQEEIAIRTPELVAQIEFAEWPSNGHLRIAFPFTGYSEVYLSLNFIFLLQVKPQAGYKAGLFLLIFCFCLFACGKRTAHLKWEDTSDNEEGFRIYRITAKDTTKIAEVGPNVTTYIDKEALAGACYAVSAYNSAGESSPSNTACLPD